MVLMLMIYQTLMSMGYGIGVPPQSLVRAGTASDLRLLEQRAPVNLRTAVRTSHVELNAVQREIIRQQMLEKVRRDKLTQAHRAGTP